MLSLLLIVTLITCPFVYCTTDNSGCVFDLLYSRNLDFTRPSTEGRFQRSPFSLFSLNDQFKTIDQCVSFCQSHDWCTAVSNYPCGDGEVGPCDGHLCQFHTDKHALGMSSSTIGNVTFRCNEDTKDFHCDLDDGIIINLDGYVFSTLDASAYGASPNEILLPSRIISFEQEQGVFCKVMRTDNDMFHGHNVSLYSEYYGNLVGYPGMWTSPLDRTTPARDGGPVHYFHKSSVLPAASGFPLTGIQRFQLSPVDTVTGAVRDFVYPESQRYNYFRHEYLMQPECLLDGVDDLIDRDAVAGDEMFYIRSTVNNKIRYLKAETGNNVDSTFISWLDHPTTRFMVASFHAPNVDESFTKQSYDKILIGIDENGNEVGWLDRNICNLDTEGGRNGARLLSGGKTSVGDSGFHCGVPFWNFVRQTDLRTMPFEDDNRPQSSVGDSGNIGGGSMITSTNGIRNRLPVSVALTPMGDVNNPRGEVCSLFIDISIGSNRHICSGHDHAGANSITLEKVDTGLTGRLYSIFSDVNKTFELTCDVFGTRQCLWKKPSEISDHQIFRTFNNYVANSDVTKVLSENNNKRYTTVYEKHGGVWSNVGMLRTDTNNKLFITDDMSQSSNSGVTIRSADNKLVRGNGLLGLNSTKVSNGEHASFIIFGSVLNLVDVTNKLKVGEGTSGEYIWVSDTSVCPTGYYVHQIRCKKDQLCTEYDLGCVKARQRSCIMHEDDRKSIQFNNETGFVSCPNGYVMKGRTNQNIECVRVEIKPQKPASHKFPSVPAIGGISKQNPLGVSNRAGPSDKNWVGTPIQAFVMAGDKIDVWHYGTTCVRSPSGFNPSSLVRDIGINQVTDTPLSCPENKYIAFIQCQQENCASGINLYCASADKHCEVVGEGHLIKSIEGSNQIPVCPSGMAAVGVGCTKLSQDGKTPCAELDITCKEIVFNPHFVPPAPSPSGGGASSSETRVIIISLGVGIPLLVIGAILCLFCIPDKDYNKV